MDHSIKRTGITCSSPAFLELSAAILGCGKSLRFKAQGVSMQPLVRDGDVLLIKPVNPATIRPGEIVLFQSQRERVIVHRVLRKRVNHTGVAFLVQGDQAAQPDGWISQDHIFGRLVEITRGQRRIQLRQPAMRLLSWMAVQR